MAGTIRRRALENTLRRKVVPRNAETVRDTFSRSWLAPFEK
jgi:hypothetical protein